LVCCCLVTEPSLIELALPYFAQNVMPDMVSASVRSALAARRAEHKARHLASHAGKQAAAKAELAALQALRSLQSAAAEQAESLAVPAQLNRALAASLLPHIAAAQERLAEPMEETPKNGAAFHVSTRQRRPTLEELTAQRETQFPEAQIDWDAVGQMRVEPILPSPTFTCILPRWGAPLPWFLVPDRSVQWLQATTACTFPSPCLTRKRPAPAACSSCRPPRSPRPRSCSGPPPLLALLALALLVPLPLRRCRGVSTRRRCRPGAVPLPLALRVPRPCRPCGPRR
jgi:hypothetical protein